MFEYDSFRERDWKVIFTAGVGTGVFLMILGISLVSPQGVGNTPVTISGSDPEYTLRLIQAIGILLPLFTGLLRLTTSDYATVGQDINRFLFIGILLLVVGGIVAVVGGLTADMAGILRGALIFVLFTFVMIAVVAALMFQKIPTESSTDGTDWKVGDDEDGRDDGKQDASEGTSENDEVEPAQTETNGEDSEGRPEQTGDADDGNDSTTGNGSEQL